MTYQGGCHCGRIAFAVDGDIESLVDCNCSQVCGVATFGEGTGPDGEPMAAVNVRCLHDLDTADMPVRHVDGRSL
ncbi:MAG TPA: hypothetical protein VFG73_06980 [Rhodanobacteraceae bacterium]|nr:hypothetical protein [Rhodanobacteraceae bacterium]